MMFSQCVQRFPCVFVVVTLMYKHENGDIVPGKI